MPEKQLFPRQEDYKVQLFELHHVPLLACWGMQSAAHTSRMRKQALSSESWEQFRYKLSNFCQLFYLSACKYLPQGCKPSSGLFSLRGEGKLIPTVCLELVGQHMHQVH